MLGGKKTVPSVNVGCAAYNERIRRIVARENELRAEIDKIIQELEAC